MLTKLVHILVLVALMQSPVYASDTGQIYTVFLVRHAEKMVDGSNNPPLSECGKQRAAELAIIFRSLELEHVYSSAYTRTLNTAQPIANERNLDVVQYDPRNLNEIARTLQERKRDALVVGHSNTTAVLAGLLVGQELGAFDESIYDRIYQVIMSGSEGRLSILHQPFECAVAAKEV